MYRIIEPIGSKTWYHRISRPTKRHGVGMPSTSRRTTENVYAVEAHVLSQEDRPGSHRTIPGISMETDWYFATEMTPSFLVSKVYFTCWKAQNLCVQIWTSITLDPVNRTWLNSQEIFTIDHSNDLLNFIELFSELTKRVSVQLGHSVYWEGGEFYAFFNFVCVWVIFWGRGAILGI